LKREVVLRWLKKAESDFKSAELLLKANKVITDSICFHCQQAIEKYFKAFLTDKEIRFGKIHDLRTLYELCVGEDKDFERFDKEKMADLTYYAVDLRYPDEFYIPTPKEAQDAYKIASEVKKFILDKLKIKEDELK